MSLSQKYVYTNEHVKIPFLYYSTDLIVNLTKSQNVCLDNSVLICYCEDDIEPVSCIGKNETNDSFVDWAAFASVNHNRYSFVFSNLTRLTYLTFTNFSLTFPYNEWIKFTFINGLDEIEENAFQELNYYSDVPVDMTFTSPQDFKLADNAFGRSRYFEIIIDSIQYSRIHQLPYEFNLKAMDGTKIYQMSVIHSGEMQLISNGSSTIELTQLTVTNCSLANASLLLETLSTSLVDLDLSSNHLIEIPSMVEFQEMREIDLRNNFIEEITSTMFSNMVNLFRLDLSNNRIRKIASDSFTGMSLIELDLNNNFLTSLETGTIGNRTTSFLYPLNESLAFFAMSNNFIRDLGPLKHMINLDNVTICCNQVTTLDGNMFEKANRLEWLDLSYNQIEFIDPMAFNGTVINFLNLAGNPFSSLENSFQENVLLTNLDEPFSSNTSLSKNQTTSFLYAISSTIINLSFSNCTNLIEINWFIITKLQFLYNFELSALNKTETFWLYRKTDVNNEDSLINWNYPPGPHVVLNGIRLTDNDYCLTKPIVHILNTTTLVVDIDHPCNCFIFKFRDLFDSEQRPVCIYNDSIVNELSSRCADIDLFCQLFTNNTTTLPFTEWTSLSLDDSSTTTQAKFTLATTTSLVTSNAEPQTNITLMSTAFSTMLTSSITVVSSEDRTEQPSVSGIVSLNITSTLVSSQRSNGKEHTKIILATIIPSIFIITLGLISFYLYKRKKVNNLVEDFEMHRKILHNIGEE